MKTVTTWNRAETAGTRGAVAAIGNFDGVHVGHLAVIDAARDEAARAGAPFGVLTFEPHPREVFAPDAPPFRLMNAEAKANRLERLGVDVLFRLEFDRDLASLDPEGFCRGVLADGLGLRHVVVGEDFRFGRGRAGSAADLASLGEGLGFGVTLAPLVDAGGVEASSTAIRAALAAGKPRDAARMLGHLHRIEGPVLHGEKRGRDLGYPTANMSIDGLHPPLFGVYAVRADVLTGPRAGSYGGAASIGVRPMFGGRRATLETHVLDFDGDLYGEHMSIAFVEYLRPEAVFDGTDALAAQMAEDCARARDILAAT